MKYNDWVLSQKRAYKEIFSEGEFLDYQNILANEVFSLLENKKIINSLNDKFIESNKYLYSGVSISDELGLDEVRISIIYGEKMEDQILINSLKNKDNVRWWRIKDCNKDKSYKANIDEIPDIIENIVK